ncbi:MAG: hypothetical protein HZB16_11810 [Armatimonadetes bacterium]|nr:hypothetical protein [Armatimonadota bacterium]
MAHNDYALKLGIPSLDGLLPWPPGSRGKSTTCGIHVCGGEATTVAFVGGDGTGKSVLAMHMAATYHSELRKDGGRSTVYYVSSDLSHARAKAMWTSFGLDQRIRRVCFCESKSGTVRLGTRAKLVLAGTDAVSGAKAARGARADRPVPFIDLASRSTGDDWGYLCRLVGLLPTPSAGERPHMLVIDSVDGLFRCGGRLDAYGEERSREDCLTELMRLASRKCHLVLLAEEPDEGKRTREQYDCNVVFRLRVEEAADTPRVSIQVEKTRGQQARQGRHEMAILPGSKAHGLLLCNSYVHVYPSISSESLDAEWSPDAPADAVDEEPSAVTLSGIKYLDAMVGRITRQQAAGHITALIGEEGTHKLYLANAFLTAHLHGGQPGKAVLLTTRTLSEEVWRHELRTAMGEARGSEHPAVDLSRSTHLVALGNRPFSAERLLHRIRRAICHVAEFDADGSPDSSHWQRMATRDADYTKGKRSPEIRLVIDDLSRILHDYPDVGQQAEFIKELERLIKQTGVQAMLVNTQRGQLRSAQRDERADLVRAMADQVLYTWKVSLLGSTAVAISASPLAPRGHHASIGELRWPRQAPPGSSRLLVDPHLDMYDGLDKADPEAVPVQLRVHLYRETNGPTVSPGDDASLAAAAAPPHQAGTRVAARGSGGEPASVDHYFREMARWLSQSMQEHDRDPHTRPTVVFCAHDDYGDLRNVCYASGGMLYGHSQVVQIDEWWADTNGNLLPMDTYLDETVETDGAHDDLVDPYRVFSQRMGDQTTKGIAGDAILRRLDCVMHGELDYGYDLLVQAKCANGQTGAGQPAPTANGGTAAARHLTPIDRFPHTFDFGFLMLHRASWSYALASPKAPAGMQQRYDLLTKPFTAPTPPTKKGRRDWHESVVRPFLDANVDSPTWVTWAEFIADCEFVASLAGDMLPFGVAMDSTETMSCLVLEIWASLLDAPCSDGPLDSAWTSGAPVRSTMSAAGDGCRFGGPRWMTGPFSLHDLLGTEPGADSLRRAIETIAKGLRGQQPLGDQQGFIAQSAPSNVVAARHWYSTAAPQLPHSTERKQWVAAVLPGMYSVRGDWFLGIGHGSRSTALARRAVDLLSSHRANAERLHCCIGLPVRRTYQKEVRMAGFTRLAAADGKPVGLGTIMDTVCGMYGPAPGRKETINHPEHRRWLWRSSIRNYHHNNRVWIGWLRWVIEQALSDLRTHGEVNPEWWPGEIGVIKAALRQSEPM